MIPRKVLLLAATIVAAGCAMTPEANLSTNLSIESARSTYRQAAASPEVRLRAPVELEVAERALAEADRLRNSGADPAIVAHHAYLAEQRARIAMTSAEYRKAEAALAISGEQRDRVLIEARNRELEAQSR